MADSTGNYQAVEQRDVELGQEGTLGAEETTPPVAAAPVREPVAAPPATLDRKPSLLARVASTLMDSSATEKDNSPKPSRPAPSPMRQMSIGPQGLVQQAMKNRGIGELTASRFKRWKHEELVDLLISQNIELRGEEYIPISNLRALADELYANKPEPQKLPPTTDEDYDKMTRAALLVQNHWIKLQAARRMRKQEEEKLSASYIASLGYAQGSSASSAAEMALEEEQQEEALQNSLRDVTADSAAGGERRAADVEAGGVAGQGQAKTAAKSMPVRKQEEWVSPSWEVARAYADARHPRKYVGEDQKFSMLSTSTGRHCCVGGFGEQCDLFGEGQVSEFGMFGPGVTNYFKWLKWNIWVFLMLSIMSIVPICFNYYGPREANNNLNTLAMTTAGNLVSLTNSTADIVIPGCSGYDYNGIDCNISGQQLALVYAYIDIISVVFVLLAYVWLRVYEKKEAIMLDQSSVHVADFSVKFTGLPKECTNTEFKNHLVKVTNQAVAGVYFAYDNSREIKGYRARGKLVQEKYHVRQKKLYYTKLINEKMKFPEPMCGWCCGYGYFFPCSCKRDKSDEVKLWARLDKKNAELGKKIKEQNLKLEGSDSTEPLCAFVTFETKIGALFAKSMYQTSWFAYFCMEEKHRFKGKALRVTDAPEPSTILWENLSFTRFERLKRRYRTATIAALLLLISFLARLFSTVVERSAQSTAGESVCPANFNSLTVEEQEAAVTADPEILHCYCDSIALSNPNNPLCQDYFNNQLRANLITYLASFMVVIINMVLEWAVNIFADYEKHHSMDSQGRSIFMRLFWLYVINSGVVFIVQVNTKDLGFIQQITGYAPAPTVINFTADWYEAVGAGIILVQLTGPIAIQASNLYAWWSFKQKRDSFHKNPLVALTQDELNHLHLGPQFKLSSRYGQVLATFFVCMIFSMGIPLLNMVGFFAFLMTYFVEKFLFIHYYRSPPRYSSSIALAATRMIPLAVVVHIIFSIWMLSIDEIFANTDSNNALTDQAGASASASNNSFIVNAWISASKKETFPLFVLLVLVVLALIFEFFSEKVFGSVGEAFVAIFGPVCSRWGAMKEIRKYNEMKQKNEKTKAAVTYSRAIQRGIFKGLATYNILQNPYYMEAFSISSKFASEHTSVNSLKFTKKNLDTSQLKGAVVASDASRAQLQAQKAKKQQTKAKVSENKPRPSPLEMTKSQIMQRAFEEDDDGAA